MTNPIGPLTAADEGFCHQIVDTFAVVGSSDLSWTEKVCAMAAARDGSLQLGFGLGKYNNRNVMDAYAGTSPGRRADHRAGEPRARYRPDSRRSSDRSATRSSSRCDRSGSCSNRTTSQPIAFDWLFEGALPAAFEDRTHQRTGYRSVAPTSSGTTRSVAARGGSRSTATRTEMTPDTWVSTRDHSWGVRYGVGQPLPDIEPRDGDRQRTTSSGRRATSNDPTARLRHLHGHEPLPQAGIGPQGDLGTGRASGRTGRAHGPTSCPSSRTTPSNRRLRGGRVHCTMADGSDRTLRGRGRLRHRLPPRHRALLRLRRSPPRRMARHLHVEGERIDDCSTPENARRVHQIRDTVVRITDPVGGGVGLGQLAADRRRRASPTSG